MLGETLAAGDAEVDRTYALFAEVWSERMAQGKGTNLRWGSGYCPIDFDVTGYIDTDYDEGTGTDRKLWSIVNKGPYLGVQIAW